MGNFILLKSDAFIVNNNNNNKSIMMQSAFKGALVQRRTQVLGRA